MGFSCERRACRKRPCSDRWELGEGQAGFPSSVVRQADHAILLSRGKGVRARVPYLGENPCVLDEWFSPIRLLHLIVTDKTVR